MKLLQLIFFMITIVGSSFAHSVTWLEYDSADSTDTATTNDRGKIPRLKYLEVAKDCNNTYKFGVVILHGTIKDNTDELSGTDFIVNSSDNKLRPLMEWLKSGDVCALVVAPTATVKDGGRRWDTDNTATADIERMKLNNLINTVASLTSEGVFLMGGSSGAIMTHNVAFNAINDGTTGNLEGIVIVDGVSAKRVCYDDGSIKGKGCNPLIDATGLDSGKSWTLPTLMLYASCDRTIRTFYKMRFAADLKRSSETVRAYEKGHTHSGDAWIQGTNHIINGIRDVLPHLNLSSSSFVMPLPDSCPDLRAPIDEEE